MRSPVERALAQDPDNPSCSPMGGGRVRVGQDDRELVAAIARRDVAFPQGRTDLLGSPGQQPIAKEVAKPVVDQLEVVEVDHQDRQRRARALRTEQLFAQPLVQVAMVEVPGELVAVGQVAGIFVQARVLERDGGLVGHRAGERERRLVQLHVGPADELDQPDRATLGDERQHG